MTTNGTFPMPSVVDVRIDSTQIRMTATSGPLPPHAVAAAGANAWMVFSETAAAAGDHETAEAAARAGLEMLGDAYRDPSGAVADDTALRVLGADKTSDQAHRATMLRRGLEARMSMYTDRFEASGLHVEARSVEVE